MNLAVETLVVDGGNTPAKTFIVLCPTNGKFILRRYVRPVALSFQKPISKLLLLCKTSSQVFIYAWRHSP